MTLVRLVFAALTALATQSAVADANLKTCLDGRYPTMCNKSQLTPDQLQMVQRAEHTANLATCIDGRYPTMCRHGELTTTEAAEVRKAEHVANYTTCMDGRYPTLCRHGDLEPSEAAQVQHAEHTANLSTCLDGRYRALCRHNDLTSGEAQRVAAAEARYPPPKISSAPATPRLRARSSDCESGHWISKVLDDGKFVELEDGSLWEVDGADTVDSALWLPTTEIVACEDKLINTEDNEKVDAVRIK